MRRRLKHHLRRSSSGPPDQEKPTRIIHIVADGCIDEKVMKAIELKAETQNDLLDRLKLIN
jgi:SNF2 family DNA or RNA helicase